MSKLTVLATIFNTITIGLVGYYSYFSNKSKKIIRETISEIPFQQLINGNKRHQLKKTSKIAAAIVKGELDVNNVFDSDNLYVIKLNNESDFYEQEGFNIASKLEYAINNLGIRTFFIIGSSNDYDILKKINFEETNISREISDEIKKDLRPRLREIISCLGEKTRGEINKTIKPYYAVYDDITGHVTFYHYEHF